MQENKFYVIGIDFGTLSGRAVLVDISNGEIIAHTQYEYPHGVIEKELNRITIPDQYALQHPNDYLEVLYYTIPALLDKSQIRKEQVVSIGTDFTACTVMPTLKDGTPLCCLNKYKNNPHAYVKLWKHHAAQPFAEKITALARELKEPWLANYGGSVDAEWELPKVLELLNEDYDVFQTMDCWIEAADWIVWQLTGQESRNISTARYNSLYSEHGFPENKFLRLLDPRLENFYSHKMKDKFLKSDEIAGYLTTAMAKKVGLCSGIPIAAGNVDAYVGVPAAGISDPGVMLITIGTSTCHVLMSRENKEVPGIYGMAKDGILPGYVGYEAGQTGVGDMFSWYCENFLQSTFPAGPNQQIEIQNKLGKNPDITSHGLICLDWFNGNRSILSDYNLKGCIIGLTLQTKAEEIYQAMLESTAYGTKIIIENFVSHGVPVDRIVATGGIARKSKYLMQMYSDILEKEIEICDGTESVALGSAIYAATVASNEYGGYSTINHAIDRMAPLRTVCYRPNREKSKVYNKYYSVYKEIYKLYGIENKSILDKLKG